MPAPPPPSPAQPIRRRALPAALIAVLALALAAGCGSGRAPQAAAGRPSPAAFQAGFVAFAACMRAHGLPSYPDPQFSTGADGEQVRISPGNLNPDTPAFHSADRACHHLQPGAPPDNGRGIAAAERAQGLRFAGCMRAHHVPGFPDPSHDGGFDLPAQVDPQAPQFKRAMAACARVQPSSLMLNQHAPGVG